MTNSNDALILLESVVKMPLMDLPVTSVCVPVTNGLVLISPGSQLQQEQLKSLGNVTDIVAPSFLHAAGVLKATQAFPQARVWGPRSIAKVKSNIKWTHELSKEVWPYNDELHILEIKGMPKVREFAFIHKKSKTLILCDLCFNIRDAKGFGAWLIQNLFGTYNQFAMSRFFAKFIKDRKQFEQSVSEIMSFDFENICVSHGSLIKGNGKNLLYQALAKRGF